MKRPTSTLTLTLMTSVSLVACCGLITDNVSRFVPHLIE